MTKKPSIWIERALVPLPPFLELQQTVSVQNSLTPDGQYSLLLGAQEAAATRTSTERSTGTPGMPYLLSPASAISPEAGTSTSLLPPRRPRQNRNPFPVGFAITTKTETKKTKTGMPTPSHNRNGQEFAVSIVSVRSERYGDRACGLCTPGIVCDTKTQLHAPKPFPGTYIVSSAPLNPFERRQSMAMLFPSNLSRKDGVNFSKIPRLFLPAAPTSTLRVKIRVFASSNSAH